MDSLKINVIHLLPATLCIALSFGNIGCNQTEVMAETTPMTVAKPSDVANKIISRPFVPVKQDVKKVAHYEVKYELPFEPRENPFVLRNTKNRGKKITSKALRSSDIKLIGLMNDGKHSLAALEINGRHEIVRVGSWLGSSIGASDIRVLQIHESDIVIEQHGKQIVLSLLVPR